MKVSIPFIVAFVVAMVLLGVGVYAQSSDTEAQDALHKYLEQLGVASAGPPGVESPEWKLLSRDLGLQLEEDSEGVLRGRLYVLRDGKWTPVAVDGFAEVAPQDLLLQRQGL
jgi:hypothetical protein